MVSAQILKPASDAEVRQVDELNSKAYVERNRDPKLSFQFINEALTHAEKIGYLKGKADALSNLGFYHMQLTNHDEALRILMEALLIHEEISNEEGISNVNYNLCALQLRFANFNLALEHLQRCISIREKLGDKAGLANCYFQMIYINEMFGHYNDALEMGEKALEIRKELGDRIGVAAAMTQMGCILRKQKKYAEGRAMLEEALQLRSPEEEIRGYFATVFQWVELLVECDELEKAFAAASGGLKIALAHGEWFGIMRYQQQLGKILMLQGKLESAEKYFEEAMKIAGQRKFKSIMYEVYELLSELNYKKGNFADALDYYKKFHALKEEVINAQSGSQLKSIQLMNEIESSKRDAELERVKNVDLKNAMKIIEEKQKEIIDSIHYAKRIQESLLTNELYIHRNINRLAQQ